MHLTKLAEELGDKPAYVLAETGWTISYAELEARSNQISHLFADLGLRPGDHVALLLKNRLELFPFVWAAQRSGLYYTPVNWHLTVDESAYILDNCEAQLLLSDAELEDVASAAVAAAPAVTKRYVVGGEVEGIENLDAAVAEYPITPRADEKEGYYMFYSSGTTGRPKGILPELSLEPFGTGVAIDHTMGSSFGFGRDTVFLSTGPLYHAAPMGWAIGAVRNGGTVVVAQRFDAERTLRAVQQYRVTHAQFVPTMFVRLLKLPEEIRRSYDVSSLEVVVHAAAPCPVDVKQRMIEWLGPKLLEFYAGSEGNGFFMITSEEWLAHPGSVGRCLLGEVHILDDDGNELPPGQVGTIWMGGRPPFRYHQDEEKTRSVFNDKGWSTLGDLGKLDEEGYLYLSDRRTDLILSGGVNIYPREVEDALVLHPNVKDVAVIGLPDEEMGQRVHAVVEPAEGVTAGSELEAELIAYIRDRIAHYKAPRSVTFEAVPRLPSGKILKRELLARYADTTKE